MGAIAALPDIIVPGKVSLLLVTPAYREFALTRLLSCEPSDLANMQLGENHMLSSKGPVCVVDWVPILSQMPKRTMQTPIGIQQYLLQLPKNANEWNYPFVLVQDYALHPSEGIQQYHPVDGLHTAPRIALTMTHKAVLVNGDTREGVIIRNSSYIPGQRFTIE